MKRFLAAIGTLITSATMTLAPAGAPAANASDPGINPHFSTVGWWNLQDVGSSPDPSLDWQYTNYPVPCLNEPTGGAWEVIYAYKAGTSSTIPSTARNAVARAGSIFAASAKQRVSTWAQVRNNSYAPRWETSGSGDGNCAIQFNLLAIPASVWPNDSINGGTYDWWGDNGWGPYLESVGANEPNRKYIVLRATDSQNSPPSSDEVLNDPNPGPGNIVNGTAIAYVPKGWWGDGEGLTIAHEMTHSMGGLSTAPPPGGAPHNNSLNPGHASDCGDIMCYSNQAGQTWSNGCGTQTNFNNYTHQSQFRLDCNGDDYFNPGASWANTRWAVHNSAYLWGSGAQPVTFPQAPPSDRIN